MFSGPDCIGFIWVEWDERLCSLCSFGHFTEVVSLKPHRPTEMAKHRKFGFICVLPQGVELLVQPVVR